MEYFSEIRCYLGDTAMAAFELTGQSICCLCTLAQKPREMILWPWFDPLGKLPMIFVPSLFAVDVLIKLLPKY